VLLGQRPEQRIGNLVLVDEIVRSPAGKPDYQWAKDAATAEDSDRQPVS
jgi:hypothetical protein